VNVVGSLGSAIMMVMFATGIYSLQWWLERSDYERHFED
jgi:hypothetical protein